MGGDVIQKAIQTKDDKAFNSSIFGVFVTAILFFFPVGLLYLFIFYKSKFAFIDGVYLFAAIYLIGAVATLMYYRFVVTDPGNLEIDKISLGVVSTIFGKCFTAFFGILGFTMLAISLNPSMIRIFENTVGFSVCRWWGVNKLLNQMLKSEIIDKLTGGMSLDDREEYMNYDFLLTTWNLSDKDALEKTIRAACKDKNAKQSDLNLDFSWNVEFITEEKLKELMDYIDMKYYVGHFTWVYIAATFSLLTSLIAVIMN